MVEGAGRSEGRAGFRKEKQLPLPSPSIPCPSVLSPGSKLRADQYRFNQSLAELQRRSVFQLREFETTVDTVRDCVAEARVALLGVACSGSPHTAQWAAHSGLPPPCTMPIRCCSVYMYYLFPSSLVASLETSCGGVKFSAASDGGCITREEEEVEGQLCAVSWWDEVMQQFVLSPPSLPSGLEEHLPAGAGRAVPHVC